MADGRKRQAPDRRDGLRTDFAGLPHRGFHARRHGIGHRSAVTAAGIVLPIVPSSGVRPELLVLAVGGGKHQPVALSDSGFWMFRNISTWEFVTRCHLDWNGNPAQPVGLAGVLAENALWVRRKSRIWAS